MHDYKVIRGGKSGTGLLIEGDAGFIEPGDIRNKPFLSEININNDLSNKNFEQIIS